MAERGYLKITCRFERPHGRICGAAVGLVVSEVRDAFYPHVIDHDYTWTHRVNRWEIVCDEGHVLADSSDLYDDDDNPPLPSARFLMWDVPMAKYSPSRDSEPTP